MSKCFIQLSKFGDVISILGILQNEFQTTGQKPVLMVCRDFASVLEGVSYVEPLIFNGAYDDLKGAIRQAKRQFSEVVVLQTHGNIPIAQTTPSFQYDQWARAGCETAFYDWPTVFDQRREVEESRILVSTVINGGDSFGEFSNDKFVRAPLHPFILFGDHSQSSPFLHKEELATMLKTEFPKHRLVRLSELKCVRIYDLLGLFDAAAALVTVETAHVHLSKASSVPTFVLAANGWRGSAWHPKFKLYMRYAAWDRRKGRLMEAIRNTIDGRPVSPPVKTVGTLFQDGYNLSTAVWRAKVVGTYRYHNNGDWKTALAFNDGESTTVLRPPTSLKNYSLEDPRLFVMNDRLYAAYVVATTIDPKTWRAYVAYGEIKDGEISHIQPVYHNNDFSRMTKNWCPLVHDGKLHFIYGISGQSQVVIQVDGNSVRAEYRSPAPVWDWGEIRGGVVLPHKCNLLRFFHSRVGQYAEGKYFVGASIMEAKPPFKTLAVSSKPVIEGDERYTPNVKHWKANVAIPYGGYERDGKFYLSIGRNDCECAVAELTEKDLNL